MSLLRLLPAGRIAVRPPPAATRPGQGGPAAQPQAHPPFRACSCLLTHLCCAALCCALQEDDKDFSDEWCICRWGPQAAALPPDSEQQAAAAGASSAAGTEPARLPLPAAAGALPRSNLLPPPALQRLQCRPRGLAPLQRGASMGVLQGRAWGCALREGGRSHPPTTRVLRRAKHRHQASARPAAAG